MCFRSCSVYVGKKPETTRMLSLLLCEISSILQTFPTFYTLHLSLLNKTSALAVWFLHRHFQSLRSRPVTQYTKLHTLSKNHQWLLAADTHSNHRHSSGGGRGLGWGRFGVVVRWWGGGGVKALRLFRGTVISGGRGEVWRCQPWILVTGCWWSLPTFPGTPHSGIYSQKCRSKSWAVQRPSADRQRRVTWWMNNRKASVCFFCQRKSILM